eukprot:INCI16636.1.p1 GENE.INCI16636.1~~INCI16636.1.p1  ORF type:complete len:462 (-),score=83.30 INCI16636.1:1182-2567(-)
MTELAEEAAGSTSAPAASMLEPEETTTDVPVQELVKQLSENQAKGLLVKMVNQFPSLYKLVHDAMSEFIATGGGDLAAGKAAGSSDTDESDDLDQRKLFIRGLPWVVTEKAVRKVFQEYGEITECAICVDRVTRRSRGYGFLTYKTVESAQLALRSPAKEIGGRTTQCNLACERSRKNRKGGNGNSNSSRGGNVDRRRGHNNGSSSSNNADSSAPNAHHGAHKDKGQRHDSGGARARFDGSSHSANNSRATSHGGQRRQQYHNHNSQQRYHEQQPPPHQQLGHDPAFGHFAQHLQHTHPHQQQQQHFAFEHDSGLGQPRQQHANAAGPVLSAGESPFSSYGHHNAFMANTGAGLAPNANPYALDPQQLHAQQRTQFGVSSLQPQHEGSAVNGATADGTLPASLESSFNSMLSLYGSPHGVHQSQTPSSLQGGGGGGVGGLIMKPDNAGMVPAGLSGGIGWH